VGKKSAGKRPSSKRQPAKRRVLNPTAKAGAAGAPRKRATKVVDRAEQWIIGTRFDSGDIAFWGKRWGWSGLTPYRGTSHRYETENAALYVAYGLKERHVLKEFRVERLPLVERLPRPRKALPPGAPLALTDEWDEPPSS
jgi:hypothetical protein